MHPEDYLFQEWHRARKIRDTTKSESRRRAYYVMADHLQYTLQDFSPYGHQLVWGSQYHSKREAAYNEAPSASVR